MLIRKSFRAVSPWQDVENYWRAANAVKAPGMRVRPAFPTLNVWTHEDGAIVEAKLPGVNPEELDLSVEGQTVTIAGFRAAEASEDGQKYLRRERRFGNFSRSFELPFTVEVNKVEASFKNGILNITLPKAEIEKPKKIVVKNA